MQLTPRRRQKGISLIEVLVSIFVVSMGILALAGLLNASSRLGKASEMRATATLLANDIADRMRANPAAFTAVAPSSYDQPATSYAPTAPSLPGKVESGCAPMPHCTPAEIAAIDLYEWQQRVFYTLPGGQGYAIYTPGDPAPAKAYGPRVDIWVAWTDVQSAKNGESQAAAQFHECPDGITQPRCVYLQVAL